MHNVIYTIIYFPVQILKIETQHIFVIKERFLRNTHEIGKIFKKLLVNDLSFFFVQIMLFRTYSLCVLAAGCTSVCTEADGGGRVVVLVEWDGGEGIISISFIEFSIGSLEHSTNCLR